MLESRPILEEFIVIILSIIRLIILGKENCSKLLSFTNLKKSFFYY